MVVAQIENAQVVLRDASSGMYVRTIHPTSPPTRVRTRGDVVAITVQSGSILIYNAKGIYQRTL